MPILLQISKITFEKGENLKKKKNHISQNLAKILTENCCCCFVFIFSWFSYIAQEEKVFENLEKNPFKLHYQTLIILVVTQQVKYEILEG